MSRPLSASQREALRIIVAAEDRARGRGGAWSTNRNDAAVGFVASGSAAALERRGLARRLTAYGDYVPTTPGRLLVAGWHAEELHARGVVVEPAVDLAD